MQIKTRLFAVIGSLAAAALIIGGVAVYGFQRYQAAVGNIEHNARISLLAERANGLIFAVVME
ncbi:Tar ligand binding domain-containing protein, partial [Klebsiella pneumoniae]